MKEIIFIIIKIKMKIYIFIVSYWWSIKVQDIKVIMIIFDWKKVKSNLTGMIRQYVSYESIQLSWFFIIKSRIFLTILFKYHINIYIRIFSSYITLIYSKEKLLDYFLVSGFQDIKKNLKLIIFLSKSYHEIGFFLYDEIKDFRRYDIFWIDMNINIL